MLRENQMNTVSAVGMETMGAVRGLGEVTMGAMMANGTGGGDKPKPQPKPEPEPVTPQSSETARQALQQSMDRRW